MRLTTAAERNQKTLAPKSFVWVVSMSFRDNPSDSFDELYSSYKNAHERFVKLMPDEEDYRDSEERRCDMEGYDYDDPYDGIVPYKKFISSKGENIAYSHYVPNEYGGYTEEGYCLSLIKEEVKP